MASRYYSLKKIGKRLETPKDIEVTEKTVGKYSIIPVKKGTRLDNIANDYYNDPTLWWAIARVNELKTSFIEEETNLIIPENINGIIAQI